MTDPSSETRRCRSAIVLGATGYLGTHIAQALRDDGIDVTTVSRGPSAAPRPVSFDVLNASFAEIREVLADVQPDVVINCVGLTAGDPAELVRGNVVAVQRVFEVVRQVLPESRFIHLGSAGEYGAATQPGQAVDENTPERPVSGYGFTKLAGTRLLLAMAADVPHDVVVLRVFNPIGPGAGTASLPGRIVQLLYDAVQSEPHAAIDTAPLDAYRDYIDVRDVASAVVAVAKAPALAHKLYNVAGGTAVSTRKIVQMLAEEASFRGEVNEARAAADRSAAVSWQQGDISRSATDFGWRPRYELSSTIKELWRWINDTHR